MRLVATAVFFALAVAGTAAGQERLVMAPYPGVPPWRLVTNKSDGARWLREQIPGDQRIETYRDILTSQSFPNLRGASSAGFLANIAAQSAGACEHVRVNGPTERTEGGYKVAYAQIYCSRQNGEAFGVNMFFKAIAGDDALYAINRDFRVPPSETAGVQVFPKDQAQQVAALMKAQAAADSYLVKSIYLCGARATDPRCKGR